MAVPDFNAYVADRQIIHDKQAIDHLYADYVQWLINKKQKEALVSELLLQINIISAFVEGKVKAVNESFNNALENISVDRRDHDTLAVMAFFSVTCGIICAVLIGASFAPGVGAGVVPMRFFGIIAGIDFIGSFLLITVDVLSHKIESTARTRNAIDDASKKISQQIRPVADSEVNPVLQSVKATLLTACVYHGNFSPKITENEDKMNADTVLVDLSRLNQKLRN